MRRSALAASAALSAALLSGWLGARTAAGSPVDPTTAAARTERVQPRVLARTALAALPVKGRAARTGYSRSQFGPAWADTDRNGCDTRNDVLRRDLRPVTVAANGCVVQAGRFVDPYTAASTVYRIDGSVEIDHVVPLADAWVKGAQRLTPARRIALANDPLNLVTTTRTVNRRKGDGDAATWLPPAKAFRCTYVARQIAVKRGYGLWVTQAEAAAMARILAGCPQQVLPVTGDVAPPARRTTPSPTPTPSPAGPTAGPTAGPATDPRFPTCTAAKQAGYGPYYRGRDPEYAWYRDADSDGIVCE